MRKRRLRVHSTSYNAGIVRRTCVSGRGAVFEVLKSEIDTGFAKVRTQDVTGVRWNRKTA
jgi:hypothetical protein